MLKKWGFIYFSLVIVIGCSEEIERKSEVEESEEVVQTEKEAEQGKVETKPEEWVTKEENVTV